MSEFNTHGGYFAPAGYMKVETGGSHEENPNGGVQIGVDPQGVPNMLEEGEPVYNDYVFSDNIKVTEDMVEKYKLPKQVKDKLYSDAVQYFMNEAEQRPFDATSRNGLEAMLMRLADAQEEQKQADAAKEFKDAIDDMSADELTELASMLSQPEESISIAPEQDAVIDMQVPVAEEQSIPAQTPMAEGGFIRKYWPGGPVYFGYNNSQAFRNAFPRIFGQTKLPDYLHYDLNIPGGEIQHSLISSSRPDMSTNAELYGPTAFGYNNIEAYRNAFPEIFGGQRLPDFLHYSNDPTVLNFNDEPNTPGVLNVVSPRSENSVPRAPSQSARPGWGAMLSNPGIKTPTNEQSLYLREVPIVLTDDTPSDSIHDLANELVAQKQQTPTSEPVPDESEVTVDAANALPTGAMYAGAVGSGLLALQSALQSPDRYTMPRVQPYVPEGRINLQNQRYNPLDQNMIANTMLAQGNAAARGLRNSGLGASSAAAQLAADYNLGRNLGTGFIRALDANNQQRNNVIAANNQAEAQRAQFDYGVDAARKNALARAAYQNAQYDVMGQRLNNQAESEKYAAVSQNLSNALQGLSNIGRQNFILNQVNSNRALYDRALPNGWAYYNPNSYGGFIKTIKK